MSDTGVWSKVGVTHTASKNIWLGNLLCIVNSITNNRALSEWSCMDQQLTVLMNFSTTLSIDSTTKWLQYCQWLWRFSGIFLQKHVIKWRKALCFLSQISQGDVVFEIAWPLDVVCRWYSMFYRNVNGFAFFSSSKRKLHG